MDDRGRVEPPETIRDRLLHRVLGAPHVQPARPQGLRKPALLQARIGAFERDGDGSGMDREGHGDTMNLTRMPRILRSLLPPMPLLVVASVVGRVVARGVVSIAVSVVVIGVVIGVVSGVACRRADAPRPEAASRAQASGDVQPERLASPPRIVFLGDSLTAGLGLPREEAVPSLIQEWLHADGYPYEVVNAGVSGDTSAGGLSRLEWSLEGDVEILVIELGANDGLRGLPVSQMKSNLSEILARAQQRGITVILTGMEAPPNYGIAYTSEFRQVFRDLADEHDVAFVPFYLEGVAGIPSLNNSDGMHPNAAGARIIAETLWRALEPVIEKHER